MQQKSNDGLAGGSFFVSLVTISSSTYVSLKSSEVFTPSIYSRVRASRTDSLVKAGGDPRPRFKVDAALRMWRG